MPKWEYEDVVVGVTDGPPTQWPVAMGEDAQDYRWEWGPVLAAQGGDGWELVSLIELPNPRGRHQASLLATFKRQGSTSAER